MKHKQHLILSILLSGVYITDLHAQESVQAAGRNASGLGGTVSYTVGQVVYTSISGPGGSANQGVQQPYDVSTVGIDEHKEIQLICSVYPNPTVTSVTLKIENYPLDNLRFELFDLTGSLVITQTIYNTETFIPMDNLAAASYLLKVVNRSHPIKTFKIIKNL